MMTPENSEAARVLELLRPALAEAGYSRFARFTLQGRPFRVLALADEGMLGREDTVLCPKVEIYEADAYPNERGEVFLNTWNAIGSGLRERTLAALLTSRGFPARITTHRRCLGLRVKIG